MANGNNVNMFDWYLKGRKGIGEQPLSTSPVFNANVPQLKTPQTEANPPVSYAPLPSPSATPGIIPATTPPITSYSDLAKSMPQAVPEQKQPFDWGRLSSILGRAAGAFGQSNYNARTGQVSTWGARLGDAMAENREQEFRSQGIAADSSYRSALAQRMQRETEQQAKQDELIGQISQNPEFQKSITEATGLPPEFSQLVIQGLSVPQIATLLRNPDKFPVNTKIFEAIGINLPEGTTAGDLKMISPFLQSINKPQSAKPVTIMQNGKPTIIDANTGELLGEAPPPTPSLQWVPGLEGYTGLDRKGVMPPQKTDVRPVPGGSSAESKMHFEWTQAEESLKEEGVSNPTRAQIGKRRLELFPQGSQGKASARDRLNQMLEGGKNNPDPLGIR